MALSVKEFRTILTQERFVELTKLKAYSQHGIPQEVRGEVWKYLLNVAKPDKSEEMSLVKMMTQQYSEFDKVTSSELKRQIRGEIKRHRPNVEFFRRPEVCEQLERIVIAFVNHNSHVEYIPGMISLLGPFVFSISVESDMYYCFQGLYGRIESHFTRDGINTMVGHFIPLFRTLQPELYNDFEEEEVEPREWLVSWIQFLLVRELPLESVLRLWDAYLAQDDLGLHIYVCLAILSNCQEDLLELEHSEIKGFLQRLPMMDMDQIITKAYNIREEADARGLLG